jgi:hypothetical protein
MNYKISDGTLFVAPIVAMFFLPGLGVVIALVCFLLWIADKVADAQVKEAMKANPATVRAVPQSISTPVSTLSEEEKNEIIEAAIAETQRQMEFVICPDLRFREKYFDTVFTRLCERQGLKVDKFFWKKIEG